MRGKSRVAVWLDVDLVRPGVPGPHYHPVYIASPAKNSLPALVASTFLKEWVHTVYALKRSVFDTWPMRKPESPFIESWPHEHCAIGKYVRRRLVNGNPGPILKRR